MGKWILLLGLGLGALVFLYTRFAERINLYLISQKDKQLESFWIEGVTDLICKSVSKENREYLLNFIRSSVRDFRDECYTNVLLGTEHCSMGVTEAFKKIVYSKEFYPPVDEALNKTFRAEYCKLIDLSYKRCLRMKEHQHLHRWFSLALFCSMEQFPNNKFY